MRYVADDGKFFDNIKECKEYEAKLEEENRKKETLLAEKQSRYQEIEDAYKNYCELVDKYEDDYDAVISRIPSRIKYPSVLDFLLS